jgi:NitT/TauT family transport system substrate-binding protein
MPKHARAESIARGPFMHGMAGAGLASLLGAGSTRAALAQGAPSVTIAAPANDSAAEYLYAADLGFFTNAGLNVQAQVIANAGTISSAVASGAIGIGGLTVPIIALAQDRNIPLRIVAPGAVYTSASPTTGLIVLGGSPIRQAVELNGKTVGVRDINNLNTVATRVWMAQNGGDAASLRFIEIAEPLAVEAMKQGRIDAACISNPSFSNLTNGDARVLATVYDNIAKYFLVAVYFTTEDYARAHPDIVKKVAAVIASTAKWANENHAQSAKILEKYSGSPVPANIPRVHYAEQLRAADVQPVLDALFKYNAIKKPMRAAELFAPGVPWV